MRFSEGLRLRTIYGIFKILQNFGNYTAIKALGLYAHWQYQDVESAIEFLLSLLRLYSEHTEQHSRRVAEILTSFAEYQNWKEMEVLKLAGLSHDIGKIAMIGLANKNGELTERERDEMKKHVAYGVVLLRCLASLNEDLIGKLIEIVGDHHEYFDGSGYPNCKSGKNISEYARALTIVDHYAALTEKRAYRGALDLESAIEEMNTHSETSRRFDPKILEQFLNYKRAGNK